MKAVKKGENYGLLIEGKWIPLLYWMCGWQGYIADACITADPGDKGYRRGDYMKLLDAIRESLSEVYDGEK